MSRVGWLNAPKVGEEAFVSPTAILFDQAWVFCGARRFILWCGSA